MDYIFVWMFIAFVALVFVGMLYDNFKCRHEWEQKTYSVIDYTTLNKITKVCLVCKKCGKVKVLK